MNSRHLTEFVLVEAELINCDLKTLIEFQADLLREMIRQVIAEANNPAFAGINMKRLAGIQFPLTHWTYAEACERLNKEGAAIEEGDDLSAAHEQQLIALNGGQPLFLSHFPFLRKFFNAKLMEDGIRCESVDLLLPPQGRIVRCRRPRRYD